MLELKQARPIHQRVIDLGINLSQVIHIEEAVEALNVKLKREEIEWMEKPYKVHEIMGHS